MRRKAGAMGHGATALAGAAAGTAVGALLLVLTHPTTAYTNDAYRSGASAGFVLRYCALGIAAAFLIRALGGGRRPPLAALGLVVVVALAIVPPLLDQQSESEKRKAQAAATEDPAAREQAEFRAGAIDGCVNSVTREVEAAPDPPDLDPDAYCTCLIDGLIEDAGGDAGALRGMAAHMQSGQPPPAMRRLARGCVKQA